MIGILCLYISLYILKVLIPTDNSLLFVLVFLPSVI